MKLTEYAKQTGISYATAYRWFKAERIPGAWQSDTGTIIVPNALPGIEPAPARMRTVIYARVSFNGQRHTNLETQAERMAQFCTANGWVVDRVVKEVASGLSDQRPKLDSILKDPGLGRLVVEHRDRLTRFGFNYLQTMGDVLGFEIVVADKRFDGDKADLMADFTAIITSFCARLYSQRRGKHKADKLKAELRSEDIG